MMMPNAGQASRNDSHPSLADHHDPPALEMLPDYRPNWPLRLGLGLLALAVAVFILYPQLVVSGEKGGEEVAEKAADPAQQTHPAAATIPVGEEPEALCPPPTPRERAEEWQDSVLGGTPFGDLPMRKSSGRFHLVYEAQPGDSIAAVVRDYRRSLGQDEAPDLHEIARESHTELYGRGLWPGDEVLLTLPEAATGVASGALATHNRERE